MEHDGFPDPEKVATREDFAAFVDQLRADLAARPDDWENPTLDRFLEALAAYAMDVPGYIRNFGSAIDPERPSWPLFALVLAGPSRSTTWLPRRRPSPETTTGSVSGCS